MWKKKTKQPEKQVDDNEGNEDELPEIEQEAAEIKMRKDLDEITILEKRKAQLEAEIAANKQKEKTEELEQIQAKKKEKYVSFIQPAREGILDTETNELIGESIYDILAEILNKQNNILRKIED